MVSSGFKGWGNCSFTDCAAILFSTGFGMQLEITKAAGAAKARRNNVGNALIMLVRFQIKEREFLWNSKELVFVIVRGFHHTRVFKRDCQIGSCRMIRDFSPFIREFSKNSKNKQAFLLALGFIVKGLANLAKERLALRGLFRCHQPGIEIGRVSR